jgi:hypothetical protein
MDFRKIIDQVSHDPELAGQARHILSLFVKRNQRNVKLETTDAQKIAGKLVKITTMEIGRKLKEFNAALKDSKIILDEIPLTILWQRIVLPSGVELIMKKTIDNLRSKL